MKEVLSKFTFAFLMAQFLPGAVVVYACSFAFWARWTPADVRFLRYVGQVGERWFDSITMLIVYCFLSLAVGMLIHGIHWFTLGVLENLDPAQPIRQLPWHRWRVAAQVAVGPVVLLYELWLACKAPNLEAALMHENVCDVNKDQQPSFQFLQDFYLYFGQFYAHMSYAFMILVGCSTWTFVFREGSWKRWVVLAALYFLAGLFFVLGRVTLSSLFMNEQKFATKAGDGKLVNR